jgi:hypothetical protein
LSEHFGELFMVIPKLNVASSSLVTHCCLTLPHRSPFHRRFRCGNHRGDIHATGFIVATNGNNPRHHSADLC